MTRPSYRQYRDYGNGPITAFTLWVPGYAIILASVIFMLVFLAVVAWL
jgi:hypothetical protein